MSYKIRMVRYSKKTKWHRLMGYAETWCGRLVWWSERSEEAMFPEDMLPKNLCHFCFPAPAEESETDET